MALSRCMRLIVAWFTIAMPLQAVAEEGKEVVVLNLEGEVMEAYLGAKKWRSLSKAISTVVYEETQGFLRDEGFEVFNVNDMLEMAERDGVELSCPEAPCGVSYATDLGISYVVVLRGLEAQDQLLLTLKLLETSSGGFLDLQRVRVGEPEQLRSDLRVAAQTLFKEAGLLVPHESSATAQEDSWQSESRDNGVTRTDLGPAPQLVQFATEPKGATILRNGAVLCEQSPCSRELMPGQHQITAKYPGFPSYSRTVTVTATKRARPQMETLRIPTGPMGHVKVEVPRWKDGWFLIFKFSGNRVKPNSAPIKVNGRFVGYAPLTLDLPVGRHAVQIGSPFNAPKTIIVKRGRNEPVVLIRTPTVPRRIVRITANAAALLVLAIGSAG